jgi:hypothetical protein
MTIALVLKPEHLAFPICHAKTLFLPSPASMNPTPHLSTTISWLTLTPSVCIITTADVFMAVTRTPHVLSSAVRYWVCGLCEMACCTLCMYSGRVLCKSVPYVCRVVCAVPGVHVQCCVRTVCAVRSATRFCAPPARACGATSSGCVCACVHCKSGTSRSPWCVLPEVTNAADGPTVCSMHVCVVRCPSRCSAVVNVV